MVELDSRMLKLHKDLPKARTAPDKTAIERRLRRRTSGLLNSRTT
jgi:hypothetical protein